MSAPHSPPARRRRVVAPWLILAVVLLVTVHARPAVGQSVGAGDLFDELRVCKPGATLLVTVITDEVDEHRLDIVADLVRQLGSLPDRAVEILVSGAGADLAPVSPREAATPASADRLAEFVRQAGRGATNDAPSLGGTLAGAAAELSERADALSADGGSCPLIIVATGGEPVDADPDAVWVVAPAVGDAAVESAQLVAAIRGGTSTETELSVCAGGPCDGGQRQVVLEPILGRFSFTVAMPSDTAHLYVSLPRGAVFPVDDRAGGPIDDGSFTVRVTWVTPEVVRLEASLSPADDDWYGPWGLVVVDVDADAPARLVVALEPGVVAQVVGGTRLVAGVGVTLSIELVDVAGRLVGGEGIADAVTVLGVVRGPDGSAVAEAGFEADAQGLWRGRFELDEALDPGSGPFRLELSVAGSSATGAGVEVVRSSDLTVLPASAWPTVSNSSVRLDGDAGGTAVGTVTVVGGTDADGCVWLASTPTLAGSPAPARLGIDGRSAASCIVVPAGQAVDIPLALSLDGFGPSTIEGSVNLALALVGDDASTTLELPIDVLVGEPIDTTRRALIAAAMSLVALILPLVALWLLDWTRAKFRPARAAVATNVLVSVWSDGSMYRVDTDGSPLLFSNDVFESADLPRARRFEWRGLEFGVRNARSPLSPPVGTVQSPDGPVVASGGAIVDDDTVVGRVPLNLGDTWIFVLDPEATRRAARDPGAPDFFAAYGRLVLIRTTIDTTPIDLSAFAGMAQRLARTVRSERDAGIGTAQEMLDFVEANAAAPRDLPRRRTSAVDDETPVGRTRQLPSGDRYDFSDLDDLFDAEGDGDDGVDLSQADDRDDDEWGGGEETGDALGIVIEREVNPAAFLAEPVPEVDEDEPEPDSGEPDASAEPGLGWASQAKPSWPVPGRRKGR